MTASATTIAREFEVWDLDEATLKSSLVAELRIDGKNVEDCWKQAEEWRDENAPTAEVIGVFKDHSIAPVVHLLR